MSEKKKFQNKNRLSPKTAAFEVIKIMLLANLQKKFYRGLIPYNHIYTSMGVSRQNFFYWQRCEDFQKVLKQYNVKKVKYDWDKNSYLQFIEKKENDNE